MSRDTSADTTLDGANMGTREDFRKWWKDSGIEFASIFETGAAEKGWNARQPEIDALITCCAGLKLDIEILHGNQSTLLKHSNELADELEKRSDQIAALKAENERMKAENATITERNHELWLKCQDALVEVMRLRADAERYRWLKANCFDYEEIGPGEPIGQGGLVFASTEVTQLPDSLDSAIDAAMKDFSTQLNEE